MRRRDGGEQRALVADGLAARDLHRREIVESRSSLLPSPSPLPSLRARSRAVSAVFAVALAVPIAAAPRAAHAGEGADPQDASYFWNGGALPFFWGALGTDLAFRKWVAPRGTPLLFSTEEGGQPKAAWEVPAWALRAGVGAVGLSIALGDAGAEWYHVKGLAESMATAGLATTALKLAFGRRRPDYVLGDLAPNGRSSFPSGHATTAFVVATYSALYLREHVFDRVRDPGLPVVPVEVLAYAGIAAGATVLSLERTYHNRHHAADLLAGGAIGAATSIAFFFYQEHRADNAREAQSQMRQPGEPRGATIFQLGAVF
jgi:membrane-associated phospholipid phosphatase